MATDRLPTYFISHGGGPWPWIKDLMPGDWTLLESSLQSIPVQVGVTPTAVLTVSGHWEEPDFTVQTNPHPPMLYDYGGFPDFTYRIQYPAPGSPEVAARVVELLDAAGIANDTDPDRGFDHGVFAPLFVMYPDAAVPVLQLSLRTGYDPAEHLAAGRALAPLRDEGVLIVGSGFSYHNLGAMGAAGVAPSRDFAGWLDETLVQGDVERRSPKLLEWDRAPGARFSHPAADHLIPLMVAVGAAEHDAGTRIYHETDVMGAGITSSSFAFGLAS
jgi:aromatic ring-opening dioxygenase catalytic subunit (LigB family)